MSNAFSVIWTLYLTLDCFAVRGSNLLWQVTKIIRHFQTCLNNFSVQLAGYKNATQRDGGSTIILATTPYTGYKNVTQKQSRLLHSTKHPPPLLRVTFL